jgi:acyl transferase domain-containing protein/aryl carrier-like protein
VDDLARRIAKLSPQQRARLELQLLKKKGLPEPIAIVGIGCRFPGAENCREFWQLLKQGRDAIAPIPPSRWSAEAFYDADPTTPGKTYCREGGFLDHIDQFDPEFFGIAPREAKFIDPQQRVFLEVVWAALEDGGIPPKTLSGSKTGVFVGISTNDYGQWLLAGPEAVDTYTTTGLASTMAANRLSYLFNLRGPSLAIDTACSSSLVSVHLACQSLQRGESAVAIAGGVNLILRPELTIGFSKLTALSPENRCKAFDAAANGFVRSEGAGAVVLKPLSQAISNGDSVYAVIRGSAVNQDGRTNGLTAPNREAQEQVIQSAFHQAGLTPEQVDYIEAHGTGTLLGDPIEAKALGNALQNRPVDAPPVRMGSVKSNIGHTEAAAGIASLIKTALCLKHRTLVPSLHFQTPNPHIPFANLPLQVQQTCESWPIDRPADRPLAGVSAFAFGGTNAHVVLQAAPDLAPLPPAWERPRHVLALSAKTPAALSKRMQQVLDELPQEPDLADLCYSIHARRADFPYRRAIAATTLADLKTGLAAPASPPTVPPSRPQVVFLFTGQGSQYGGMGQELYNTQPVFRDALDHCAEAVSPYLDVPLLEAMFAAAEDERLQQTAYTQPALFALEYALAMLWQDWGIQPAAVLGHSVGEYVAACVAGVLSLEDGLRLIAQRGKLMQSLPSGGVMAAVWANEATVAKVLAKVGADQDGPAIATVNGPHNTVIAGQEAAIAEVLDHLHTQGTRTQYLEVSHAFHSPQMEPILPLFEHMAQQVTYQPARIPMGLNVTGQVLAVGDTLEPQYWCRHARQAVRFADGLQALHQQGLTCFLELGPHPILCGLGRRVLTAPNLTWLPTLRRGQDDWTGLLASLGTLYEQGFTVDWQAFDQPYGRTVLQGLPSYPFQRQRYWFEPPATLTVIPAAPASATTQDFYHLTWETLPTLPSLPDVGGRWLIFMDEQGLGAALTQVLQAHQAEVVAIHQDKTFAEASSESFRLNPFEPDASQALFAQLNSNLGPPWRGVIYLWGLNGSSGIENAEASTAGLLHCLQGLVAQPLNGAQLWVVTQGVQAVDQPTQPLSPGGGTLWGLGAAIALEHPELWGGLVDIVPTNPPTPVLAKQLLAHCLDTDREDRVVISADQRWGARLTSASDPAAPGQSVTIQPDKTYLISGGLGALGLATAQWLVDAGATTLVLISRRGETPHHQAPLRALRQSGAKVWVEAVDVADPEAMHRLIQTIQTDRLPLAGIIHGAGTLDDGLLVGQSWAQFQTVMAPKVQGAWNLHTATADLPLDFFVLFSSVASLLGSPGQGNYAAANGFLDSLAQYRRQQGLPAQSINWGPWQGSGLATQQGATVQRLKNQGIDSFTPAQGIQHLETLLTQGSAYPAQVAAIQVHWPVLMQKLPQSPPWLQQVAPTQVAQPAAAFWEQLVPLDPMARVTPLQSYLHQEISAILGRTETIPVDRNLLDVGLDSLMVMDLLGLCKRDLGLTLYPREVFEHPTLATLSRYMVQELERIHPELGGSSNSASPDETVGEDNWRIPIWGQARTFAPPAQKLPGPVFLLSSPRSGSTLLRVMLAGHPDLFCPPELHLLPFKTLAERQDALAENYLGEGLQRALMDLVGLDGSASQQLLAQWIEQGMDIPTVYDKLQEFSGDRRLIDKSPTYGFSLSTLNRAEQIFDRAKYIHLVRHPYAVIDSFVSNRMDKLFKIPDQEPYGLAEQVWHSSNHNILSFLKQIEGDRHHTLCYEDLVRDPEQAMVALCQFLDLPFHPALVDPYGSAEQRMTDGVTAQSLPIDDPNFHRRKTIEPALADTWKTVKLPYPLGTDSQALAATWHYALPVGSSSRGSGQGAQDKPLTTPPPRHPVTWIQTEPLTTMTEQTVTVRGLDLCLCTWGTPDRPTILCLHGVLEQGAIWDAIAPTLVAQGYRVLAPDLRGHGRSAHLGAEGNYQLLDHLADIDALIQELGLEPLTVMGHSMGAMVAAALTAARPNRVNGLVLVEPVVPGADDGTQTADQLTAHLDYLTNRPTHTVYPDRTAACDRLQQALPFLSPERAAALTERILQPVPGGVQWAWDPRLQVRTRFGLSGGTFTRDRYGQILQGISVPTTLVFGKGSEFIRPEDQTFQSQRLPHSGVHHIPGGHQLPLESPQALVEIIGTALPELKS